ncbi:MAG TPA: tRNA (guanosine(46)-N7)-methyltransferase TrmB [Bacilli bacterium]|nr:tRNA (guanosine(46)-N7)-methyltransferase TrmB [Bacilli bacterium]
MRVHKKKWAPAFLNESTFVLFDRLDLTEISYPKHYNKVYLEVGVGKGAFISNLAATHRDILFIGIELNETITAIAAKKVVEKKLTNVLLIVGDARKVLTKLARNAFDRIILNHSDPWPKKRHTKRRLTFPPLLERYYELLKKDGVLAFKTDNTPFAEYTLEALQQTKFNLITVDFAYNGVNNADYMTEYETLFRSQGVKIKLIEAKKE